MRYIDADKLIEYANNTKDKTIDANDIARFPISEVRKNVRGEWLHKKITGDYHVTGQCSNCYQRRRIDNFCPNCGAEMR